MNYFFNDVPVTEAEYNKLMTDAVEAAEVLEHAKMAALAAAKAEKASKPKKAVKAVKVVKAPKGPKKMATPDVKLGSKTDTARNLMLGVGVDNKAACILAIMEGLGVTKGNATCYYANVMKKLA